METKYPMLLVLDPAVKVMKTRFNKPFESVQVKIP